SGGAGTEDNLAWSCQGCNNAKFTATAAPDPATGQLVPLFHPRRDRWDQHFNWGADFSEIIGITPTGRATVERLKLNRPNAVELRRAFRALGIHPPASPA